MKNEYFPDTETIDEYGLDVRAMLDMSEMERSDYVRSIKQERAILRSYQDEVMISEMKRRGYEIVVTDPEYGTKAL